MPELPETRLDPAVDPLAGPTADPRARPAADPWSAEAHTMPGGPAGPGGIGPAAGRATAPPAAPAWSSDTSTGEPWTDQPAAGDTWSGLPSSGAGWGATPGPGHPTSGAGWAGGPTAGHPSSGAGRGATSGGGQPTSGAGWADPSGGYPAAPFRPATRSASRRAGYWAMAAAFLAVLLVGGTVMLIKLLPGYATGSTAQRSPTPGVGAAPPVPSATGSPGTVPGAGAVERGGDRAEPGDEGQDNADGGPDNADNDPEATAPTDGTGRGGTPYPGAAPATGELVVVYEITLSGSRNIGNVTYRDEDRDTIRLRGIRLPWRLSFTPGEGQHLLLVHAQRKGGGDAGPVTCTITVNGKVLSSTTQTGRYAAPNCSASL